MPRVSVLLQALEDQLDKLRDEAARAKRQRNAVRDAAKARYGPELLAVHRSKLRQHRPAREQVIDEARIHLLQRFGYCDRTLRLCNLVSL